VGQINRYYPFHSELRRKMSHSADADCHFAASTVAAVINFPLWRASAIAQSGFKLEGSNFVVRYYQAAVKPPFKGLGATIFGMSWARGAIFCKCQKQIRTASHKINLSFEFFSINHEFDIN
jgi:hypothetical protein